jgi:hypothetical protein
LQDIGVGMLFFAVVYIGAKLWGHYQINIAHDQIIATWKRDKSSDVEAWLRFLEDQSEIDSFQLGFGGVSDANLRLLSREEFVRLGIRLAQTLKDLRYQEIHKRQRPI